MTSYFVLIYEPEAVSLGQGRLGMNSLRQKCQGAFRRQSRNQPSHKHSCFDARTVWLEERDFQIDSGRYHEGTPRRAVA